MTSFRIAILAASLVSVSGCSTTSRHFSATQEYSIREIHMADARHGWALADDLAANTRVLHTTDGGQFWENCTPPAAGLTGGEHGFGFFDSQHACMSIGIESPLTAIWTTRDGGQRWQYSATKVPLADFNFQSANHATACSADFGLGNAYYRFFQTLDSGVRWQLVLLTSPNPADPSERPGTLHLCNLCTDSVTFLPPDRVLITHGDMADEKPKGVLRMSRSTNLGKTWHDLNFPLPPQDQKQGLVSSAIVKFVDARYGWLTAAIVTENAKDDSITNRATAFYVTDDGGGTWKFRSEPLATSRWTPNTVSLVDIVSRRDAFILLDDHLLATHDRGKTWRPTNLNIDLGESANRHAAQLDFVDQRHGWMVVVDNSLGHDRLYKTDDAGSTWLELSSR